MEADGGGRASQAAAARGGESEQWSVDSGLNLLRHRLKDNMRQTDTD